MSAEDKLNELIPNIISFESGERLTADKLNKLIEILNLNLEHIQGAVGDVYDVSGDGTRNYWGKQFDSNAVSAGAQKRRFDIANLARLIGPASNLNPQNTWTGETNYITENIEIGSLEYKLKYPALDGSVFIRNKTKVENINSLDTNSKYYVAENRIIYFGEPTSENLTLLYFTNPTQYNGGAAYQGAGFNVYPDPNQVDEKLQVTHATSGSGASTYTVNLPVISDQQGSFGDRFETTNLDSRDINFNNQLKLPEWVQELADNTVLPRYSLYLKNYETNESYIDATYTKIDNTSVLITGLEIGNQACIDQFNLRLITVGTDITTSIDDLRNKMFLHKHDGSFGEPRINIKDIVGFYEAQVEGGSGPYYPSSSAGNPISNYLHRDGYKASSDAVNGDNAMRGPLMMGLTDFDPITNRVIVSDGDKYSYPLQFGSTLTYIQRVSEGEGSDNELKIKNTLGNIKLSSPSNSLVGQSNKYILTAAEDSRLTVNANASLNVNEGLQVKQLTNMPHSVERMNKGYKIEEMPYYKLMLINPGAYETPPSTKGVDPKYVDIFDIWSNNQSLGDTYHYESNVDGVDGETRFQRFYELEPGSSDKGHFLNFVLRDGAGDNPDYVQYFWANKELNANLFFDLSRGNDFIISPLFELDQDKDNYRPFQIHIFRGYSWNSTVGDQLNDLSKKFSAEYQIQVDMNFLSTLANNDWVGLFPSIILHYDYKHSAGALDIENYEIDADNGNVIATDLNATTFFAERNIRRVEIPFNTRADAQVVIPNLASEGGGNIETTEIINNYSTGSSTSLKVKIGYDDNGIAKLSRFSINVKEEFWNGVFTVGIS